MAERTLVYLVHGGTSTLREALIASRLDASETNVVIAEGLVHGNGGLENTATQVLRIAPGCPCCSGNLTMRVTLHRVLRSAPDRLFISLANAEHLMRIRQFLQDPQYRPHLILSEDTAWINEGST